MKKIFLCFILYLFAFSLHGQDKPIITVLDFKTEGISANEMIAIISLLSSSLFQTGQFTVIDVTERENLLKEIGFSLSDCTDEACQIEIGKQLAAENIVVGNITKVGAKYVLSTKLLETATGRTFSTADGIYSDKEAILDDIFNLGRKLAGLPVKAPEVVAEEKPSEPLIEAEKRVAAEKAPSKGKKIAAIILLGTGLATGGGGGYLLFNALNSSKERADEAWQNYDTAPAGSDFNMLYEEYEGAHRRFLSNFYWGVGLTSSSAVMLTASIILFITSGVKPTESNDLSFMVTPQADAVSFSLQLKF